MKFSPQIIPRSNENFCFQLGDYSFGFNGKDKESEFNSGAYDFGARIHDARLGRWMSVDPKVCTYESFSSYAFCFNSVLLFIDKDGLEPSKAAYEAAAAKLGVSVAVIRAVYRAEVKESAYYSNGKTKILFERHYFHNFTNGKYDKSHSRISKSSQGGYGKFVEQYDKFEEAKKLDEDAAYKSVSYGAFQIMGSNFKAAGYTSAKEFGEAMITGNEDDHLNAFVNFVSESSFLCEKMKNLDFKAFASTYNGSDYAENEYDTKMKNYYEEFKKDIWKDYETDPRQKTKEVKKEDSSKDELKKVDSKWAEKDNNNKDPQAPKIAVKIPDK